MGHGCERKKELSFTLWVPWKYGALKTICKKKKKGFEN